MAIKLYSQTITYTQEWWEDLVFRISGKCATEKGGVLDIWSIINKPVQQKQFAMVSKNKENVK